MPALRDICAGHGRLEDSAHGLAQIHRVDHDSRMVDGTSLFMALPGRRTDGSRFIRQALENGAVAIGLEEGSERPHDAPIVVWFDGIRQSMAIVASRIVGLPQDQMRIIAVTGTNGKTSVTSLLHQVFRAANVCAGVIGTNGTKIADTQLPTAMTTPESTDLFRLLGQMRDEAVEVVCMEYSSIGIEEHRIDETRPELGIYLNLSQDHLDYHADMEAYGQAKAKLFTEHLRVGGTALISVDDDFGRQLLASVRRERPDLKVFSVSVSNDDADIYGEFTNTSSGLGGRVCMGDVDTRIDTPLIGAFNAQNVTFIVAAARLLGVAERFIVQALSESFVPGRMERVESRCAGRVIVDYAHTPDAITAAISALRPSTEGRLICVFGCGGDRDQAKRPLMGQAASSADIVVVTSDNPRWEAPEAIVEQILVGVKPSVKCHVHLERQVAIEAALKLAKADDTVLIAGKGHEAYQEIQGVKHVFSDHSIIGLWNGEADA